MKEKDVAKAYARSFIELGEEKNVDVAKELTTVTECINASNDLENVLFLDVFTIEEKESVLAELVNKLGLSALTKNLFAFLCAEKRINIFPLIFKEVVVIDDHKKGFMRGIIEGRDETVDESAKAKLTEYIEKKLGKKAELEYRKSESVTAGYRVTVEDLQLDATLDNQLDQFKHSVVD